MDPIAILVLALLVAFAMRICWMVGHSAGLRDAPFRLPETETRVIVNTPPGYTLPPIEVDETSLTGQRAVLFAHVYESTLGAQSYTDIDEAVEAATDAVIAVFGRAPASQSPSTQSSL